MAIERVYPNDNAQVGRLLNSTKPSLDQLYDHADAVNEGLGVRARTAGGVRAITSGNEDWFKFRINFPEGRFTQPPGVTTNVASTAGASATIVTRAVDITTTGFDIYVRFVPKQTQFTYSWVAVQADD